MADDGSPTTSAAAPHSPGLSPIAAAESPPPTPHSAVRSAHDLGPPHAGPLAAPQPPRSTGASTPPAGTLASLSPRKPPFGIVPATNTTTHDSLAPPTSLVNGMLLPPQPNDLPHTQQHAGLRSSASYTCLSAAAGVSPVSSVPLPTATPSGTTRPMFLRHGKSHSSSIDRNTLRAWGATNSHVAPHGTSSVSGHSLSQSSFLPHHGSHPACAASYSSIGSANSTLLFQPSDAGDNVSVTATEDNNRDDNAIGSVSMASSVSHGLGFAASDTDAQGNYTHQHSMDDTESKGTGHGSLFAEKASGRRRRRGAAPESTNAVNSVSSANRLSTGLSIMMTFPSAGQSPCDTPTDSPDAQKMFMDSSTIGISIDDGRRKDKAGDGPLLEGGDLELMRDVDAIAGVNDGSRSWMQLPENVAKKWRPLAVLFLSLSSLGLLLSGMKLDPMIRHIPPETKIMATEVVVDSSTSFVDNYSWLSKSTLLNPDATAYINAENLYQEGFLETGAAGRLKKGILKELYAVTEPIGASRGPCSDFTMYGGQFWSQGDYFYWKEMSVAKPFPVYKRKKLYTGDRAANKDRDGPFADRAAICGCPIGAEVVVLDYNSIIASLQFEFKSDNAISGKHKRWIGDQSILYGFIEGNEHFLLDGDIPLINVDATKQEPAKRKFLKSSLNGDFFREGVFEISPNDQDLLTFSFDLFGSEHYFLFTKHISTQKYSYGIPNSHTDVRWVTDAKSNLLLFNAMSTVKGLPNTIYSMDPATKFDTPKIREGDLIWKEGSAPLWENDLASRIYTASYPSKVGLVSTSDNKFVFIQVSKPTSNELLLVSKTTLSGAKKLAPLFPLMPGVTYSLSHQDSRFFLLTNSPVGNLNICADNCLFIVDESELLRQRGEFTLSQFLSDSIDSHMKRDDDLVKSNDTLAKVEEDKDVSDDDTTSAPNSDTNTKPTKEGANSGDDIVKAAVVKSRLVLHSMKQTLLEHVTCLRDYVMVWIRRNGVRELLVLDTKSFGNDVSALQVPAVSENESQAVGEFPITANDPSDVSSKYAKLPYIIGQRTALKNVTARLLRFRSVEPTFSTATSLDDKDPSWVYAVSPGSSTSNGMTFTRDRVLFNSECLLYANSSFASPVSAFSLDLDSMRSFSLYQEYPMDLDELSSSGRRLVDTHSSNVEEPLNRSPYSNKLVVQHFDTPMVDAQNKPTIGITMGKETISSIPMSVVFERGTALPAPVYLRVHSGVGSRFDASLNIDNRDSSELQQVGDPGYSPELLPLLTRGIIVADCYTRGSSAVNHAWHIAGTGVDRPKALNDVQSCILGLISRGMTIKGRIVVGGDSLDGVAAGYVANELGWQPGTGQGMVSGIISRSPLMDPLSLVLGNSTGLSFTQQCALEDYMGTSSSSTKLLTSAQTNALIAAYSPYNNIVEKIYPSMMIVSPIRDVQIPVSESLKYVARMRSLRTNSEAETVDQPVILKLPKGGHHISSIRSTVLEEQSAMLAYIVLILRANLQ